MIMSRQPAQTMREASEVGLLGFLALGVSGMKTVLHPGTAVFLILGAPCHREILVCKKSHPS